jgi:formylglycine-generating enzyme required for sulfatase activity
MVGNVRKWTEDCYHDSYGGAPSDGTAWTSGDCSRRIVRGGSWIDAPNLLRSASRDWLASGGRIGLATDERGGYVGFRVGRTLIGP